VRNGQTGMPIPRRAMFISVPKQVISEPEKALCGNSCGGAINRLPFVKWIGSLFEIIAQPMQVRGASVPHRDAVGTAIDQVKIGRGDGSLEKNRLRFVGGFAL